MPAHDARCPTVGRIGKPFITRVTQDARTITASATRHYRRGLLRRARGLEADDADTPRSVFAVILGVLALIAGVRVIVRPGAGLLALVRIVGRYLIVGGVLQLASALSDAQPWLRAARAARRRARHSHLRHSGRQRRDVRVAVRHRARGPRRVRARRGIPPPAPARARDDPRAPDLDRAPGRLV